MQIPSKRLRQQAALPACSVNARRATHTGCGSSSGEGVCACVYTHALRERNRTRCRSSWSPAGYRAAAASLRDQTPASAPSVRRRHHLGPSVVYRRRGYLREQCVVVTSSFVEPSALPRKGRSSVGVVTLRYVFFLSFSRRIESGSVVHAQALLHRR